MKNIFNNNQTNHCDHVIGGAAVTKEIMPGFKFSRCSYLQSLLHPTIIRELELGRHGLKLLRSNPSSFTPCLDGRYLLLGVDKEFNRSEISKFSEKDAIAFTRLKTNCISLHSGVICSSILTKLGQKDMMDFVDLLVSPASKVFNNWFEAEVLKATLATDVVIGSMTTVHTPGSGYVLLHHVMGETDRERGIWSYVEGGMGSVSLAISNAACEARAHIFTNAEVSQVLVDEKTESVSGVQLADGTELQSSVVLSNATAYRTFVELLPSDVLPDDFLHAIKKLDYSSGTTKINLVVDKLPQFLCCKSGLDAGPQHVGTIHIGSESMEKPPDLEDIMNMTC